MSTSVGSAGRSGVSILFYKSQQEYMIPPVERKSGVQFQRIEGPQPVDIVKARAKVCQVRHTQDVYICITSSM